MEIAAIIILAVLGALLAHIPFPHKITAKEVVLQSIIVTCIIASFWYVGKAIATSDTLFLNGEVTAKAIEKRSCPSGWQNFQDSFCENYRTRQQAYKTCTKEGCTTSYTTQYKYKYPWEKRYFIHSNLKKVFEIAKEDAQGRTIPKRFEMAEEGDPVTVTERYTNYLKNDSSIFAEDGEGSFPSYPKVYDYYKVDRVIDTTNTIDIFDWNNRLSEMLKILGPSAQVNIIIVLTDKEYGYAKDLKEFWKGAKKNDVVVVISIKDDTIQWAEAFGLSKNNMVFVRIRDGLRNKPLDRETVLINVFLSIDEFYERIPMEEFEYLKYSISPPTWYVVTFGIISVIISGMLSFLFYRKEV